MFCKKPAIATDHLSLNVISNNICLNSSEENILSQLAQLRALKIKIEQCSLPITEGYKYLIPSVLSHIAQCHCLLNHFEKALPYLSQYDKYASATELTEFLKGCISESKGDHAMAEKHWKEGLKIESRGIYAEQIRHKLATLIRK